MIRKEELTYELDDRLEQLAAGIVERVSFDSPELAANLRPPKLRVVKGPPGVNSYCVANPDGTRMILVGADLYTLCHQYTRAASAYFLPAEEDGPRPSPFWPAACASVATTLDWMSSPADTLHCPKIDLTPHQAHVARAFGDFSYRFALCHEIAHVALAHLDEDSSERRSVDGEDVDVLRASQEHEISADRLGLELQVKSLPDTTQLVTALASSVYFLHIVGLSTLRLSLLAQLVDAEHWKVVHTHPPLLYRLLRLMGQAESLCKSGSGLQTVHESLAPMDGELVGAANEQQEEILSATRNLIDAETAKHGKALSETSFSANGAHEFDVSGAPVGEAVEASLRLWRSFYQSPLGVLRALEKPSVGQEELEEARLRPLIIEQLASMLPPEFQRFRQLSMAERAEAVA